MPSDQNINPETGIRYGVINPNKIEPDLFDQFHEEVEAVCGSCGSDDLGCIEESEDLLCNDCGKVNKPDELDSHGNDIFTYMDDDYEIVKVDDTMMYVTRSPYYTYARLCSPVAPNAGDLNDISPETSVSDMGYKTYCLGHDWFPGGEADYNVFGYDLDMLLSPDSFRDYLPETGKGPALSLEYNRLIELEGD